MMRLTHNDDGKEKRYSHTVSSDFGEYSIYTVEGYGATREEAFKEFKDKFHKLMYELNEFEKTLQNNPDMIEVDYAGRPLEE